MRRSRRAFQAVFGGCLVLFLILAVLPVPPEIVPSLSDKAEHLLAFLLLGLLAHLGWPTLSYLRFWLPLLALYGGLIELIQSFLPYRSADPWDLFADLVGLALAWLLTCRLRP